MTLASKWRRFRELRRGERVLLAKAWLGLQVAWLALRLLPFPSIQSRLNDGRLDRSNGNAATSPIDLGRLIEMASRVSPLPTTCLTKSVLMCWMLRRRGIAHELVIGVRQGEAGLQAHAWVECKGSPVNDHGDIAAQFHPLQYIEGAVPVKDLL